MSRTKILVNPEKELHPLRDLYGIFFEDISYASDGGLYGELIQNRSFEYDHCDNEKFHALYGWEMVERDTSLARIHVETKHPAHKNNPHYIKIEVTRDGAGGGVRNGGFYHGISVEEGKEYLFSCDYRVESGCGTMVLRLEEENGEVIAEEETALRTEKTWHHAKLSITAERSSETAYLVVLFREKICICMDMISLFPKETFAGRENGLRQDLAQMLQDLKPKFVRFPGGCFMHIGSLDAEDRSGMFRWKNTIGPVEERPARTNHAWHYHLTGGLGFYEFFLLCEDIGAEPLPVVSGGVDPHNLRFAPLNEMQEWIDEACDLIEFANGDTSTKWGRKRAEMGHEKTFGMKYLAIGNEEVGDEFFERYEIICRAVHERYPEIQIIGSAGPGESGSEVDKGWHLAWKTPTSFVDEHYYQAAEWLIAHTDRYRSYPKDGPKAFLGEYASKGNTLYDALAESAYMTGMEKSAGVGLACYAPLFANLEHENWSQNLIWFDKKRAFGSVSYYAQKLFMNYQGDVECGVELVEEKASGRAKKRYFQNLSGQARLFSEGMNVEFSQVKINGKEVVREKSFEKGEKPFSIGVIPEEDFDISFQAMKKNSTMTDTLEGPCFGVEFAVLDEDNKLIWALDGWEQLNSIRGMVSGQGFTSGDAYYEMPVNQWVNYCLKVRGRLVQIVIDGETVLETEIDFPKHQTLYCCASKDTKQDSVILKAVNVNDQSVTADVFVEHMKREIEEVEVWTLADADRNAQNSADYPERVVPVSRKVTPDQLKDYEFPPYSVTVFCMLQDKAAGKERTR